MNSPKSLDRSMLGYQLEQDIKTLLGVRDRWKARIRIVRVVKKAEDADLFALASLVVP